MSINPNFILKEVGNDYMIIPLNNSGVDATKIFNTNETGAYIFKKLKEGLTTEELINMMLVDFENVQYEDIKNDVLEFIEALKNKGIYND